MKNFASSLAMGAALLVSLTGCRHDSYPGHPLASSGTAQAAIRVLHGSPDAPPVDVRLDGDVAISSLSYGSGTGYLETSAGAHAIEVDAAGTNTAVIEAKPTLMAGGAYTVIAVDSLSKIAPLLLEDDRSAPAHGMARVRIVHGSPNAGPVDIFVTAPDAALGAPTLAKVAFKDAAKALEVPAGDYRARITGAGSSAIAFDSGTIHLDAGANLTLVALDARRGLSPVTLVALSEKPSFEIPDSRAGLRAVHGSPDAPAVDILLDGAVVLSDVMYGQASGYLAIGAGEHDLKVNPANTTTSVIDATIMAQPTHRMTVIAADLVSKIAPLVLEDDDTAPASGNVKVRLVHGSPSAGPVDVYVTAPGANLATATPTIAGFTFKTASAYLEVPAGDYEVRITLAGTKTVAIDTGKLTLSSGQVRTAIALDPAPMTTAFRALLLADRD